MGSKTRRASSRFSKRPAAAVAAAAAAPPPDDDNDDDAIVEDDDDLFSDYSEDEINVFEKMCNNLDWLVDEKICTQCYRGGKLLVCCEVGCPVAIHENCLQSEPKFDEQGRYCCPLCWYQQLLVRSQEMKKKVMLAEKDLIDFLNFETNGSDKEKQNDGQVCGNYPNLTTGERNCYLGKNLFGEMEEDHQNEDTISVVLHESAKVIKENCIRPEEEGEMHQDAPETNVLYIGGDASPKVSEISDLDSETFDVQQRNVKPRRTEEEEGCQNTDSPKKLSPQPHTSGEKSRKEIKIVGPSRSSGQSQGSAKKFTNQTLAHENDTWLDWTGEEEEMLKEGVQKFSTTININLPWREILEFGRHVFNETRTPLDLEDKWKNIKGSSVINSRFS